jgi:hypothetical protein
MLTAFLHRRRKRAEQAARNAVHAAGGSIELAAEAVERTHELHGTRLLVRGILWISIWALSRGLLEMDLEPAALRVAIALLPVPFFVWWLWTWMMGVSQMDELERRIQLEALAFAFPLALVLLMTLGLLDLAIELNPDDWSPRHIWAFMPAFYFFGLWRAKRRYQ